MKLTHHHEHRRRVSINCGGKILTDQSFKKVCDINNIMAQYQKTGMLPEAQNKLGRYLDNTTALSLEEAHERIMHARDLFYELPAQLRKQMDNDPTKLDGFLRNPANATQLVEHGILIPIPQKVAPSAQQKADPPAAASPKENSST